MYGWFEYRSVMYRIVMSGSGQVVSQLAPNLGRYDWHIYISNVEVPTNKWGRGKNMASKWIQAAVTAVAASVTRSKAKDSWLLSNRDALADFLLEREVSKGVCRELSPLMIVVEGDRWKVGLKDPESGGWCWRVGDTVSDCLDAIEVAIRAGGSVFAVPGGGGARKKK